jgi:hypothetical protein
LEEDVEIDLMTHSVVTGFGCNPGKLWFGVTAVPPPARVLPGQSLRLGGYEGTLLMNLTNIYSGDQDLWPQPYTNFEQPGRYRNCRMTTAKSLNERWLSGMFCDEPNNATYSEWFINFYFLSAVLFFCFFCSQSYLIGVNTRSDFRIYESSYYFSHVVQTDPCARTEAVACGARSGSSW